MNEYKTSEVARMIGIHANTVRLYEKCKLISAPRRQSNGYRVFTDLHIEQFKLARAALKAEVLQGGLRKLAAKVIKTSAAGEYDEAARLAGKYIRQAEKERKHAEEAIEIARQLLAGSVYEQKLALTRKEAAEYLEVTVDTLRNWELNGLLEVKRKENGYRVYTSEDIRRLKVIRALRFANYSLASILRMLRALSSNPAADIRDVINTPGETDDLITACDRLISSLAEARENMEFAAEQIEKMKKMKT